MPQPVIWAQRGAQGITSPGQPCPGPPVAGAEGLPGSVVRAVSDSKGGRGPGLPPVQGFSAPGHATAGTGVTCGCRAWSPSKGCHGFPPLLSRPSGLSSTPSAKRTPLVAKCRCAWRGWLGDGVEAWALGRLGGVDPDSPLRVLTERGFRAGGGKGSRQRWVPSPRWPLPGRLCCSGKRRDGGLGAADPVEAGVQGAPGAQHPLVDWAQGPPASDGVGGVGCGAVARMAWAPLAAEAPAVGRAWVPGREHPGKPPWVSGCPARPALRTAVPLVVLVLSSGGWVLLEPQGGGHF